ncbi:hypothetical protein GOP47_0012415, partial [Adiantum capillus-veneris]
LTAKIRESQSSCPCSIFNLRHVHGLHGLCTRDPLVERVFPTDKSSLAKILLVCCKEKSLDKGRCLHTLAVFLGLDSDATIATSILSLYGKCGALDDAFGTFERLHDKDVISWNAIISVDAKHGHGADCLYLFQEMHQKCVVADKFTMVSMLSACASLGDIKAGQYIHARVAIERDWHEVISDSALVHMYSKWYTAENNTEEALKLVYAMQDGGINPDRTTWSMVLDACDDLESLAVGEWMYNQVVIVGLDDDNSVVASAIKLYGKFQCVDISQILFRRVSDKDFLLWNTMIMVNAQHGLLSEACDLLHEMHESGMVPDCQMLVDLLVACAKHTAFSEGRFLHCTAILLDFDADPLVTNALIDMYGDCNSLGDAWCAFERLKERSGLILTSIIGAYAHSGNDAHAIYLYTKMRRDNVLFDKMEKEAMAPDEATYASILSACTWTDTLPGLRLVYSCIVCGGFAEVPAIVASLIHLYGRLGTLEDTHYLFDKSLSRKEVTWNSMIAAHAEYGRAEEALQLFVQMQNEGCTPNISADGSGRGYTGYGGIGSFQSPFREKCSIMEFHRLSLLLFGGWQEGTRDIRHHAFRSVRVPEWAYACYGLGEEAVLLLQQMEHTGLVMDNVTFLIILSACSHSGLLESEAEIMIRSMPFQPTSISWTALVGACQTVGDVERACDGVAHMTELNVQNTDGF